MNTHDSLVNRQELFINTALLAAHSSFKIGFRIKDISFFIDLFQSWVETSILPFTQRPQRVQLKRLVDSYVLAGYLRGERKQSRPVFALTTPGLLELLSRLVNTQDLPKGPYFFFLYYFISSYGERIKQLFTGPGQKLPYSFELELTRLLDQKNLLALELIKTQDALKKIDRRIQEARASVHLIEKERKQGRNFDLTLKDLERLYPYELNHQKPLSELIGEIPADQQLWELTTGNTRRVEHIWVSEKAILESYLKQLQRLT